MVDEEDGGVEGACQLTQCGENGGDLAGVIFIGALEAYERIKDQQLGALAGERKVEPGAGPGNGQDGARCRG